MWQVRNFDPPRTVVGHERLKRGGLSWLEPLISQAAECLDTLPVEIRKFLVAPAWWLRCRAQLRPAVRFSRLEIAVLLRRHWHLQGHGFGIEGRWEPGVLKTRGEPAVVGAGVFAGHLAFILRCAIGRRLCVAGGQRNRENGTGKERSEQSHCEQ